MNRPLSRRLLPVLALLLAACGADSASDGRWAGDADRREPGPAPGGEPPSDDDEREVESDYEAPVATGNVVWIANPKSGRVALIDASTLQVRTVEAGNGPTHVASVPGQAVDTTLVLNVLSEDATLLAATPGGITSDTFKTARQANSVAFSSDGRFAITWTDVRKVPSASKTMGFQDLTVLDLEAKTSTILAVGYRPVAVGFAEGAQRAYAVTQDGVAIVDLTGEPRVTKNVAMSSTPTEDPGTRDVFVTKDGERAFVRRDGSPTITVVDLGDETRVEVELSGPVTDLDLAPDGAHAIAVVRDAAEVAILPVADPADHTTVTVTGETIGSVAISPDSRQALLYTNARPVERLTILDLEPAAAYRTVRLYSPVLAVFPTPDAGHAVVLHDASAEAAGGAFSVVPTALDLPGKIVAMGASPTAVATTAEHAVVAERDDARRVFGAYLTRMPQLMVERYALASPPIAVGVVEGAKRAYIAQQHEEGRLTFIDLETGTARTLTGFELTSRVVDGSKP